MKIANDQKPRYSCLLYGHGYQIQEIQNFIIPSTWLSYPTASKHCYACYGFLIPQFQNFADLSPWKIFWIGNPSSYILVFLEIGRNYISPVMSIVIIIVSIITLLVSQNIFVAVSRFQLLVVLSNYFHMELILKSCMNMLFLIKDKWLYESLAKWFVVLRVMWWEF